VMVTHDGHGAGFADRVLFLADGRIVEELRSPSTDTILETVRELGD
jgi:putative ABC transport system ATP-binding protein